MKTREFHNTSALELLQRKEYRKIVHVRGDSAALFFFIQQSDGKWIPWTGTEYYPFDVFSFDQLPDIIKRHIDPQALQQRENDLAAGDKRKYALGMYFEDGQYLETI